MCTIRAENFSYFTMFIRFFVGELRLFMDLPQPAKVIRIAAKFSKALCREIDRPYGECQSDQKSNPREHAGQE